VSGIELLREARASIRFRRDGVPAVGQEPWVRILGMCVEEGACWVYAGQRNVGGYGFARGVNGRMTVTHKTVWQSLNGPVPPGMYVCHACDNPPCCNPAHLWVGTPADNNRDRQSKGRTRGRAGANAGKTHCIKGHPFDDVNTHLRPNGSRACRECARAACQAYRARRGAA
jgi:hypothetical protein